MQNSLRTLRWSTLLAMAYSVVVLAAVVLVQSAGASRGWIVLWLFATALLINSMGNLALHQFCEGASERLRQLNEFAH